jgi:hypothetical protein
MYIIHSMSQIKPRDFDPSLITFSELKTNNFGGKMVFVNYNGGPLDIQTPRMHIPYDMSDNSTYSSGDESQKKYTVSLSFRGMDREHDPSASKKVQTNARRLRELHEVLAAIKQRIVEEGKLHSGLWLGIPNADETVINALFNPIIRQSKDASGLPNGKYADTISGRVMYKDSKFITTVYDDPKGEPIDVEGSLKKGAVVSSILEAGSIWMTGGKLGISWRIGQCHLWEVSRDTQVGFALMPESDSEDDDSE